MCAAAPIQVSSLNEGQWFEARLSRPWPFTVANIIVTPIMLRSAYLLIMAIAMLLAFSRELMVSTYVQAVSRIQL